MNSNRLAQISTINKLQSFDQIKWKFVEAKTVLNQTHYFIKSLYDYKPNDNLHLCATGYVDSFNLKQHVALISLNENVFKISQLFDMCKWKDDSVKEQLINVRYNLPLYSPSIFSFKNNRFYREAYLWRGKSTKGDEFKWSLVCY